MKQFRAAYWGLLVAALVLVAMDFSQFPSPRVTLPSYTKVDLSAELPLPVFRQGTVSINARVENVFDRHYQEVLNFAAPGRTLLVGGRWSTAF